MVHRVLGGLDPGESGPERTRDPDARATPLSGSDWTFRRADRDHWELRHGRVDEAILHVRPLEEHPRERDEREEQGNREKNP